MFFGHFLKDLGVKMCATFFWLKFSKNEGHHASWSVFLDVLAKNWRPQKIAKFSLKCPKNIK